MDTPDHGGISLSLRHPLPRKPILRQLGRPDLPSYDERLSKALDHQQPSPAEFSDLPVYLVADCPTRKRRQQRFLTYPSHTVLAFSNHPSNPEIRNPQSAIRNLKSEI
jgi:hypothetical protein